MWKHKKDSEHGSTELVKVTSASPGGDSDAVWGGAGDSGPDYRSLGWIRAAVLECKLQIGLGVLAIPGILHTLGFVPGLICIALVGMLTTWSDYVVGIFKLNHPEVFSVADAAELMLGPWGREIFGFLYWLLLVAIAGSNMLSVSIAFNSFTSHGTCTVAFVAIAMIVSVGFSLLQTLHKIAWIGWVGLFFLMTAILTLTITVGIQDRPSAAPQTGPWDPDVRVTTNPELIQAMSAVSSIVFAYAGTPSFFNVIAEMKNPRDYTKSIVLCQSFVTLVYLVIGSVVYKFCGQYVSSPALGSGGPLMKKVCYGIALPGLFAGAILNTHMPAKYLLVRFLKGTRDLSENTLKHRVVWFVCVFFTGLIAFIIAEAIPFFDNLVGLIGALLGALFTMQFEAAMWLWDNWRSPRLQSLRFKLLFAFNILLFAIGTFIMITGTWGAAVAINEQLQAGDTSSPFACDDNSGS